MHLKNKQINKIIHDRIVLTSSACLASTLCFFRTGATIAIASPILTPHPLAQLYTVTAVHVPSLSTKQNEKGIPDSGTTVQTTFPCTICNTLIN